MLLWLKYYASSSDKASEMVDKAIKELTDLGYIEKSKITDKGCLSRAVCVISGK